MNQMEMKGKKCGMCCVFGKGVCSACGDCKHNCKCDIEKKQ